MTCVRVSSGTKDAKKQWLPRFSTLHATLPPFTRISIFPDPADDASTETQGKGES